MNSKDSIARTGKSKSKKTKGSKGPSGGKSPSGGKGQRALRNNNKRPAGQSVGADAVAAARAAAAKKKLSSTK